MSDIVSNHTMVKCIRFLVICIVSSTVAMCSLSNSKIRFFLILKNIILFEKVNNLILLTKYFSLS